MKNNLKKSPVTLLICAAAFVLVSRLPLQAQSEKLYAPILAASAGGNIGITLVNPTLSDAHVTLTARTYAGAAIQKSGVTNPVTMALSASSQKALMGTEIFGQAISGQSGWIEVSSDIASVKGFFLVFDSALSYIDGAELASTPSNRLVFPKVSASSTSPTRLTLVNTSPQAINGSVSLYDNGGHVVGSYALSLGGLSGFSGAITDLVPSGTAFEGYVVMDSGTVSTTGPQTLVGVETYRNKSDIALIRAFPESARLRSGYLPHLLSQGGYVTSLTMVNYDDQPQTLHITAGGLAVNGATTPTVSVDRTLPAYGRLEERADQMFGFTGDALVAGYMRFETLTNTPGVIGVLDYGTTDGVVLSAVEAQAAGFSDFYFSQVAETKDYYTGMVLLNPDSDPAIVTLDNYNSSGKVQDSTIINLQPGERQAQLLSDLFHRSMNQSGGYIHLTSTRPIFAFQLFGSRTSSTFLASVPAQGGRLKPQTSGRSVSSTRGAHVMSADGSTSLLIPPGALKKDAAITIAPIDATNLPSPDGDLQPISAVEGTPNGTKFQIPVRLTFPLNADFDPGTQIPLQIYDPITHTYTNTEFVAVVDNSHRTASAFVTHFTQYVAGTSGSKVLPVSSISPLQVLPGDTITITGSGFSTKLAQDIVTFAGPANTSIAAVVQSASSTTIKATVPAGAITGSVIVKVGAKTSVGKTVTVLTPNPAPGTISVSPGELVPLSASVDVQISGAGTFISGSIVNYDGKPMTPKFVDKTLLVLTLQSTQLTPAIHTMDVTNPAPGGGTSNTAELNVVDSSANLPPIVNAGADQVITLPSAAQLNGSETDDGLPIPTSMTTTWSKVSGPGTVTFGDPSALATTATFSVAGSYVLRLSAFDGLLTSTDDLVITVSAVAPNQPPVVSAGANQAITLPASVTLSGSASDDGQPNGTLTTSWSQFNGPVGSTIANPNSLTTTVTFPAAGTYTFRLSASDGVLSSTSDVTITVNPANQAPAVNAGSNQTITLPASATLSGTATDDGLPNGTLTKSWSQFNGPAGSTIATPNSLTTTVTFPMAGTYTFRLSASDGALTSTADVTITVNAAPPTNQAPVVSAGSNQTITLPSSATLSGTATDDGLPNGTLTKTWSQFNGPAGSTIASPNALTTTVTFPMAGTYTFRLTASDGALTNTADVTITVNAAPPTNQAPTVSAGSNQTITLPATATLSGTATDDGLPTGSTLTKTWSKLSGPGTVTFGNPNLLSTTASFSVSGSYVLQLTASDSALTSSATVTITVNPANTNQPPVVNAGADQAITLPAVANLVGTATDASPLTNAWSTVSGPGPVTFSNASALSSTATFTTIGTYVLRLTSSDGVLTSSDDITVVVNPCGTVVSGSKTLTATASSSGTIAGVQFKLDNANLGAEDATAPYSYAWNTTTVVNGCHTLTAVARDASGNLGTSAPLLVTINN